MRIGAVVPAAGMSSRMGTPKPLIEIGGVPLAVRAVRGLLAAGVMDVVVVTGHCAEAVEALFLDGSARCARNTAYASTGMLESVRIGLAALGAFDAALLLPADMPAVRPETIRQLCRAFGASRAPLVRPLLQGRFGHPPLFTPAVAGAIQAQTPPGSIRDVFAAFAAEMLVVPVDDPGILLGVNTKEDLDGVRRLLERG